MGYVTDKFAQLFGDEAWTDAPIEDFAGNVLSDLLPYRVYDPKTELYYNHSTTGFFFEVPPVIGGSDVPGAVQSALNSHCPANATVQILNYSAPDIEAPLTEWANQRRGRGDLISKAATHRVQHFDRIRYGDDGLVRCVPHVRRVFVAGWIDGEAGLANEQGLTEFRRTLITAFGGVGTPKNVDPQIFVNLLAELLHCQSLEGRSDHDYVPELPLNYQLPGGGLSVERFGIGLMGEPQLSVSSSTVRKFPSEFRFSLGHILNGAPDRVNDRAPGPVLTSFTLRAMGSRDATGMMVKKRAANQHVATTKFSVFAHDLSGKMKEMDDLHAEMESGERLFETLYVVSAFARGDTSASRMALSDLAKIYRLGKFQLENDAFIQLPLFLSSLPFGIDQKRMSDLRKLTRMRLLKGQACATLLPVHGEWGGTNSRDAMMLVGRQGQLFFWDPFVSDGNYNVSVVGKSGAGKSVFMQELVTSLYATGGRVVVIDDGYSFQSTCEMLGGKWIGFDGSSEIRLNPFSMVDADKMIQGSDSKGAEEYTAEIIELITRVVGTMVSLGENSQNRVEGVEEDLIAEAVSHVWNAHGIEGEIGHVRDVLAERAKLEPRLNDIVLKLDRFCPKGMYGRYFAGPSNLTLDSPFTVFELSDIKGQKGLEAVVLQIIMFLATELMYKTPRNERVAILIDEAWDLLSATGTSKFIEGVVRRARKYSGSLITGTQSVSDYRANEAARVCFENSDWSVFLAQKAETVDGLIQDAKLGVSPYIVDQLKSLQSFPGQFAELGVKGPNGWFFGRLVLDPYSLGVYSSKGATVERLRALKLQGMSMAEALEVMVSQGEVL